MKFDWVSFIQRRSNSASGSSQRNLPWESGMTKYRNRGSNENDLSKYLA